MHSTAGPGCVTHTADVCIYAAFSVQLAPGVVSHVYVSCLDAPERERHDFPTSTIILPIVLLLHVIRSPPGVHAMSDPAVAALGDQKLEEVDLSAKDPMEGEVTQVDVEGDGGKPAREDGGKADVLDPVHRGEETDTAPVVGPA